MAYIYTFFSALQGLSKFLNILKEIFFREIFCEEVCYSFIFYQHLHTMYEFSHASTFLIICKTVVNIKLCLQHNEGALPFSISNAYSRFSNFLAHLCHLLPVVCSLLYTMNRGNVKRFAILLNSCLYVFLFF